MPSIAYTEDRDGKPLQVNEPQGESDPEPAVLYDPYRTDDPKSKKVQMTAGNRGPHQDNEPGQEYLKLRKRVIASQVMAFVSLIIGGVLLSTVAIVFAILAYRRINAHSRQGLDGNRTDQWDALLRSAKLAIAISIIAFALNAISIILLYPMVLEMLRASGDASLFGDFSTGSPTDSRGSVWG